MRLGGVEARARKSLSERPGLVQLRIKTMTNYIKERDQLRDREGKGRTAK